MTPKENENFSSRTQKTEISKGEKRSICELKALLPRYKRSNLTGKDLPSEKRQQMGLSKSGEFGRLTLAIQAPKLSPGLHKSTLKTGLILLLVVL